jgi:pyruvate kinase
MRRAKIVATVGPASESPERLRELIVAGVDVVRVNMSHGTREHHAEVIRRAREAAAAVGRPLAILADLGGPKIRTGRLKGGEPVELADGAMIRLVSEDIEGTAEAVSTTYSLLPQEVKQGDRILIDDGLIELRVESDEPGQVVARVVHGGFLNERKGINLPGVKLSIPSVTEKDHADLAVALDAGVDYVGLSFVRSADDCAQACGLIRAHNSSAQLIAKIEKPEAIDDLEAIIAQSDGVMVARGDLGVETSPESVPIYQKRIIAAAIEAEKPVITATQMLQSMIEQPRPTRAEASDVANAIFDGTDAVMLSGETAVGRYPFEAVRTMDRIVSFTEKAHPLDQTFSGRLVGKPTGSHGRAVSEGALYAAEEIGARTIVVFTDGGIMARHIASLRPRQRIIAMTSSESTYRRLAAVWGVEPFRAEAEWNPETLMRHADHALTASGIAEMGETIVFMAGRLPYLPFSTMMRLHRVGDPI